MTIKELVEKAVDRFMKWDGTPSTQWAENYEGFMKLPHTPSYTGYVTFHEGYSSQVKKFYLEYG